MDDLPTLTYVLLIPLGLIIGTYGTLSSVPAAASSSFARCYCSTPHALADAAASISSAVIALNAVSGRAPSLRVLLRCACEVP